MAVSAGDWSWRLTRSALLRRVSALILFEHVFRNHEQSLCSPRVPFIIPIVFLCLVVNKAMRSRHKGADYLWTEQLRFALNFNGNAGQLLYYRIAEKGIVRSLRYL